MMNRTIHINRNLINFGIPIVLLGTLTLLMKSSFLNGNETLHFAITADLLLTVPLIYFLLIRKSKIPNTTVIPVMIIGLLIGSYFLPKESQTYLSIFKTWALPIIELSILTLVIIKARKAIATFKKLQNNSPDFYDTLKSVCTEFIPKKFVLPFATEVAVLYYGFINWKKRKINKNEFSYHKNSGTIALLFVTIFIIGIETFVLHILLSKWSNTLAWVLTILSIYTALQLFGFLKSMSKRPFLIQNGKLFLRYGIMNETTIDLENIESIEISSKDIESDTKTRRLSILGSLESHNMTIKLKTENDLIGLYGIKRKFENLAFYVDDKDSFINKVQLAIANPELFSDSENNACNIVHKISKLSSKQKAFRTITWIFTISWLFGFTAFSFFDQSNQIAFGVSSLIFAVIPAIVSLVINKNEGGTWKNLQFVKPKLKNSFLAIITPFIYFGIILSIQFFINARGLPDWNKMGSVSDLVYALLFGYPVMLFLLLGEEIAWRGYLQEKLIKSFGGIKGLLILGLTWGIWHLPLSLQGHNLPNSPIIESFITTPLMCIALAMIIGYYSINSKSIFIGLLLHTSNNHFGGTFLYLTETYNELMHALVFSFVYIIIIITYGVLYKRKENALQQKI